VIPPKSDPRWRVLIRGTAAYKLKGLATRMLITRVRLMGSRGDERAISDAIDTAWEFFSRNLEVATDDIATIFGADSASLVTLEVASRMVQEGLPLMFAGDEALLRALPRGTWIGGTIPYFMAEYGGCQTGQRLFVTRLPAPIRQAQARLYQPDELKRIPADYPANGASFIIMPAGSPSLMNFAQNGSSWKGLFDRPLVGWVSGVDLARVGTDKAKVFDGSTGAVSEDAAVVLHAQLPDDLMAKVDIINLFTQGQGEAITFPRDGFEVGDCFVDGKPHNLARFIAERQLDTRLPLVADYLGAMVNVAIQKVDAVASTVSFFGPVSTGVTYRFAKPLEEDYAVAFQRELSARNVTPVFACNCILNYLYCGLDGRTTGTMVGPFTFGEIAWVLLTQTMVYLEFAPRG
jgi:hypothetical protein